jgi:hypothetical protein
MRRPGLVTNAVVVLAVWAGGVACSDSSGTLKDGGVEKKDVGTTAEDASTGPGTDALNADHGSGAGDTGMPMQDLAPQRDATADWVPDMLLGDGSRLDGTTTGCIGPENVAPIVNETVVPDAPPVAQGGTIMPGNYHATTRIWFNGFTPRSGPELLLRHQLTVVIDDMLKMYYSSTNEDTGNPFVFIMEIKQSDWTSLALEFVCPEYAGVPFYEYDATAESLTLYYTDRFYTASAGEYALVLTKQ